MSTRATYQIKSGFSTATLYIHHDGYPARRCSNTFRKQTLDLMRIRLTASLLNLLSCGQTKRAELTGSHAVHMAIPNTATRPLSFKEDGVWIVNALIRRRSYDK